MSRLREVECVRRVSCVNAFEEQLFFTKVILPPPALLGHASRSLRYGKLTSRVQHFKVFPPCARTCVHQKRFVDTEML